MSAQDACDLVESGIHAVRAGQPVVKIPMADGGEGTAETLMRARGGQWIACRVTGPMPDLRVDAGFAWLPDDRTAVVEMAVASGIERLSPQDLNPLRATTYGTGQLIRAALDHGAERILLTVGGSATVDGGIGAAMALGWKFLGATGEPIPLGGAGLEAIQRIVRPADPFPVPVRVLCDVDNPLTGPCGAARVFGPQKGATPDMVERLDAGLHRLSRRLKDQCGMDIETVPGAGAAGGLAGGAIAFFHGELVSGIETVMRETGLIDRIPAMDWILTGEGMFDAQSLGGKVVSGILHRAQSHAVKVGVIAGNVKVDEAVIRSSGLAFAWPTGAEGVPFEVAVKTARKDLRDTAARFASTYL